MGEPECRSKSIFAVSLVSCIVSIVAVALRYCVRLCLVKAFGWDDGIMVFAMMLNTLFAVCGMVRSQRGMGRKYQDIDSLHTVRTALLWWWLGQTTYVLTCTMAKISIALSLLRLTVRPFDSMLMYIVIGVSGVVGTVFWLILTLQCTPVSEFWERRRNDTCSKGDQVVIMSYVYSVVACMCDFAIGIFPIFLLKDLQMNQRKKCLLAGILTVGCIASAAVLARIPFLQEYNRGDFLYATSDISIWSNVEAGLGITAGSLITLRPLFRWLSRGNSVGFPAQDETANMLPLVQLRGSEAFHPRPAKAVGRHWRLMYPSGGISKLCRGNANDPQQSQRSTSQEELHPIRS
ncbi:hypothetical protein BDV24DRAFT_170105 [Aspergillus arachidicola]|uniref:Rhodopsin domain-containing protein n=1 Tax=Aspergillus arachidicola TaxID=656916 RepID=A0A5N6XMP7_9EURO|nr:hypothetical protein BDV24DRAFT_170105 [Aspergillus arachidicola]